MQKGLKFQKTIWINPEQYKLVTVYDNEPWLAQNHEDRKEENNGWTPNRSMKENGSVPILDIYKMCNGDPEAARMIMNDPHAIREIIRCNPQYQTCYRV